MIPKILPETIPNATSIAHSLSDHDLDRNSAMYGGSNLRTLSEGCTIVMGNKCIDKSYLLTEELLYDKKLKTKYYAIVGVDLPLSNINTSDDLFELPTAYTKYNQIDAFLKTRYNLEIMNIKHQGDGIVGVLSQMGWTEDSQDFPKKRILMEKIIFDVDTNGGNGSVPIVELFFMFHSKIQHREEVMKKIINLLNE